VGRQRIYTIHRHRPELNRIETFHSPGKRMVCLDFAVALTGIPPESGRSFRVIRISPVEHKGSPCALRKARMTYKTTMR
jgi:hypothetical protein